MKVDGIDPLILNRIRDQASQVPLQESERSEAQQSRVQRQHKDNRARQPEIDVDRGMLQEVEEAVRKLNDTAEAMNLDLRFQLHEDSDRWMVRVVDIHEDEIVREIPPEKVLNVVAQIQSVLGVLLDERR